MMKDERFWKDPLRYNPDRFVLYELITNTIITYVLCLLRFVDKENQGSTSKGLRGGYEFFSFGHGPRNCIGKRFALMQAKIGIFRLIANYKVVPCQRTIDEFEPNSALIGPKLRVNLFVKLVKRE